MRRGIRKRFMYVTLLGLGMNLLMGCKEKTVDYNIEGATEEAQEANSERDTVGRGKKGVKQFADEPEWWSWNEEDWYVTNAKGEDVETCVAGAEVTVPDAEEMFVVEVKEPEFDAAYKKQMAERIFEDEEIYYYDLVHLPKKDIEEQREQCQKLRQLADNNIDYNDVRYLRRQYQFDGEDLEGWKERLDQELLRYDNVGKEAGTAYTLADKYDVDEYLGMYSGIAYELSFLESDCVRKIDDGPYLGGVTSEHGNFMNCRGKEISLRANDLYQVCPEEVKEVDSLYYRGMGLLMENQCSLSEKEAKELARQFVDRLKLDYSVNTDCETLGWWKGTDSYMQPDWRVDYLPDGYIVRFEAGVDSVSFPKFGTQETDWNFRKMKKASEDPQYCLKAQMEVYVTDKGVIGMRAYHPIETVSISGGVDLLPLEAVKASVREQLLNHFTDFRFRETIQDDGRRTVYFDRMDLIYFRVRNREDAGYYSYLPVWRLSEEGYDYPKYFENPLLINAIDGSVINFYDEV